MIMIIWGWSVGARQFGRLLGQYGLLCIFLIAFRRLDRLGVAVDVLIAPLFCVVGIQNVKSGLSTCSCILFRLPVKAVHGGSPTRRCRVEFVVFLHRYVVLTPVSTKNRPPALLLQLLDFSFAVAVAFDAAVVPLLLWGCAGPQVPSLLSLRKTRFSFLSFLFASLRSTSLASPFELLAFSYRDYVVSVLLICAERAGVSRFISEWLVVCVSFLPRRSLSCSSSALLERFVSTLDDTESDESHPTRQRREAVRKCSSNQSPASSWWCFGGELLVVSCFVVAIVSFFVSA